MRGADRMDETWYGPLVRYIKKVPSRRLTEIDIVFCKFRLDNENRPNLRIPAVEEDP